MDNFLYSSVDVKGVLQTMIKEALATKGYVGKKAVKVIIADPASPAELPCIGINRISDDESNQSITESEVTLYDKDTKQYTTGYGTFFSEALEIRIWHTNADEREKLYLLLRAILFAGRRDLAGMGLLNIALRSGKDEEDTTLMLAPMPLYWAAITMTYLNPLDIEFTEIVEPITSINDYATLQTDSVETSK